MNKNEAMKSMIDGKKIVDSTKNYLHYYAFENGIFMYTNTQGQKVRADMPEHDKYEIQVLKKSKSLNGFVTKKNMIDLRNGEDAYITFNQEKTKKAYMPVVVTWIEEE